MTEKEQLTMLKAMTGEQVEEVLSTYLHLAGDKIIHRTYPFGDCTESVPQKYQSLQVEIAAYLLNKRGAEGQTSHSENGISRSYENADVPSSMMNLITPMCGVIE